MFLSEGFFLIIMKVGICVDQSAVILKPIFQLKIFMSIHQIIYFDVYVSETWVKTIYSHFCIFFYVVKNKTVIL